MPERNPRTRKATREPLERRLHDGSKDFEELSKRRLSQLDIAQDIIKRRKALGLSQVELARRAGVNQPLISRIETGNFKNFEVQTLIRIATALEARYDFVLIADPQEPDAPKSRTSSSGPSARAAAGS